MVFRNDDGISTEQFAIREGLSTYFTEKIASSQQAWSPGEVCLDFVLTPDNDEWLYEMHNRRRFDA